jgi:hypothetical protein
VWGPNDGLVSKKMMTVRCPEDGGGGGGVWYLKYNVVYKR